MEKATKIKIFNAAVKIAHEITELKARRDEIISGVASASMSAGTGSKSYSNFTPDQINSVIASKTAEYNALMSRLGSGTVGGIKHVVTVRS